MSVKHAILALLREQPLHGYDLVLAFNDVVAAPASARKSGLNPGQVYTSLERLERDKLVELKEVVSQEGLPDRRVYSLTDAGREEVDRWLLSATEHELDLRNETFLKLVLARRQSTEKALEVLSRERQGCLDMMKAVAAARGQAEKKGARVATLMLFELAELRLKAFHDWLDRCEELLSRGESA